MDEPVDNPTRAQVAAAAAQGHRDVALDCNPISRSLEAMLLEGTPGQLRLRFVAPPWSVQGNAVVGGGTLATMLDLAMAMAVLSALPPGRNCTTINLSVNMIAPAQLGPVFAQASIERLGRRVGFARATLYDGSERLLASASSTLSLFDERPPPLTSSPTQ